jgi:ribonucleoside-diphosphate reductase beta chain
MPVTTTAPGTTAAVENIPSIARKARFCFKWIDSIQQLRRVSAYQVGVTGDVSFDDDF